MGDLNYHKEVNKDNVELLKIVFTGMIYIILAIGLIYAIISFYQHMHNKEVVQLCLNNPYAFKEACMEFIERAAKSIFP